MLSPGVELSGRYRIESVLGQGGMGAVYLASMEALGGKKVAVKEMEISQGSNTELEQAVVQFQTEAKLLAHLDHPNLVQVTDFFSEAGKHYLVMAYVPGQTLQEKLKARGRVFSWEQLSAWADSLCEVLSYLHSQNPPILFRDLKPSNIMVDETGRLKLIDFGIARTSRQGEKTSTFLQGTGTSGFSPIEQYGGSLSTDKSSDVYSLGATLYYLLTGQIPPDAVSRVSQEARIKPASEFQAGLPRALDAILERCLAVRQRERYQDMDTLRREFAGISRPVLIDDEGPTEDLTGEIPEPPAKANPFGTKEPTRNNLSLDQIPDSLAPVPVSTPVPADTPTPAPAITFNMTPTRPPKQSMAPWVFGFASLAVAGLMLVMFAVDTLGKSDPVEVKETPSAARKTNPASAKTRISPSSPLVVEVEPSRPVRENQSNGIPRRRTVSTQSRPRPVSRPKVEPKAEPKRQPKPARSRPTVVKSGISYPKAIPRSYPKAAPKTEAPVSQPAPSRQEPVAAQATPATRPSRPKMANWKPGMRGPSHPDGRPGPLIDEYGVPMAGEEIGPPRGRPRPGGPGGGPRGGPRNGPEGNPIGY